MWSDWIRSLRDKELLYKKGLLLADQLEAAAKGAFEAAWKKVIQVCTALFWILVVALATTLVAGVFWLFFRLIGVEAAWCYQVLIIPVGLVWALFLVCIAILLGTFEGVIKQFPRLEKPLADVKQSILRWLRLPAWVAFLALFLAVLVGRFPDLGKPESILSLLGIIAVFGLASFLGLCSVNVSWLKRFVQIQLLIALVLLLLAPQFPNVTAWLEKRSSEGSITIGLKANPKQVTIDPDSPPEFFVVGKPRFWFSRRSEGEFVLWDTKGFDPDTNEKLKPVETKEKRDEILASLRANIAKSKRQQDAAVARQEAGAAEQRQKDEVLTQAKAKEMEQQRKLDLEHQQTAFIERNILKRAGVKSATTPGFAVLVWDSQSVRDAVLSDGIAQAFRDRSVTAATELFKDAFLTDGNAERVLNSNLELVAKLGLNQVCDFVVLGKKTVATTQDAARQGLVTARGSIVLKVISTETGLPVQTVTLSEIGGGFKPETATEQLTEKLLAAANAALKTTGNPANK